MRIIILNNWRIKLGVLCTLFGVLLLIGWWISLVVSVTTSGHLCYNYKYPAIAPFQYFFIGFLLTASGIVLLFLKQVKKMEKRNSNIFMISIFSFFVITTSLVYVNYYPEPEYLGSFVTISFIEDFDNSTLIVDGYSIECGDYSDLNWENVLVYGNATVPQSTISEGDILTNCTGKIAIIWKPKGIILYETNFEN